MTSSGFLSGMSCGKRARQVLSRKVFDVLNTETVVQRYLEGTSSPQAKKKYQEGVDAVTESPMQKAADSDQLYLQRIQESVSSGRRRQALLAVPLSRWKDNAKGKGADRLAGGARAAADKVRAHFQKWSPIYQQIKQECAAMPKGSIEDSMARVRRAIEISKQAAGKL